MKCARLVVCAAGLWTAAAIAQSIDTTRAQATIGAPLDLEVLVRATPELGAARLDRSCIQAEVLDGQRLLVDQALTIDIAPAIDGGLNRLHIRHAAPVDEPVLQARVSLICGANYTRDFTVLSHAAPHADGNARAMRVIHRPRPPANRDARPARAQPAGPRASSPVESTERGALPPTAAGHVSADPQAGASDVQALTRSVLRLFQAAGLDLQRASQGLLDLRPADPATSLAAADSKYLMQELQRLRSESQQSATAIASLHARVDRAESDRWLHATWAVLAVIAGLILLAIGVRVADLAMPALLRRFTRQAEAGAHNGSRPERPADSIERYLSDLGAHMPPAPMPRPTPAPTPIDRTAAAATVAAHASHSSDPNLGHALNFDLADEPASATPQPAWEAAASPERAAATPARGQRWIQADFGPPTLDHRRVRLHRDDIDKAISDGYLGFALVMLEQLLHSGEGKHPWVLMRLLDVYRQLRQRDNHERVCAEIEALYSVEVPGYDIAPHDDAHISLDQLDDWSALRAAWCSDQAAAWLSACLLRTDAGPSRALPTFADLLFLHELAEIRDAPPERDAVLP